jgi:hypothetical protein
MAAADTLFEVMTLMVKYGPLSIPDADVANQNDEALEAEEL